MQLPDLAEHGECRLAQRDQTFFVSFSDDPQQHLSRIDYRNRQPGRLADPQPTGVHGTHTGPVDGAADRSQQLADLVVRSRVRQPLLKRHGDLFFEKSDQSQSRVTK